MAAGEDESHRAKRRKVAESCKICRAKKTRCDGQRPLCSPCRAKGILCEYNDATVPVAAGSLADIQARLRRLEEQATVAPGQTAITVAESNSWATSKEQQPLPLTAGPLQAAPGSSTSNVEFGDERPFADNPTTNFIRDMTQIADSQSPAEATTSIRGSGDAWSVETNLVFVAVPKRSIADNLLECYDTYVHPLFPVLHMPSFRKSYEKIWESQRQALPQTSAPDTSFYAALNIVFALGCLNNSKVEPQLKLQTGHNFYQRARAILPLDALDVLSVGVIQYVLLTTIYLSYTKYSNRGRNALAVAIRAAHAMGLHTDLEYSTANQLNREMNRRIWHHCLLLDRLFSTLFGRMMVLDLKSMVPLPQSIDDQYLLENGMGLQPAGVPSALDAFVATIKVFEIMDEARKIDHSSFNRSFSLPELTQVFQLNEKLDKIEHSLPSHLIHSNANEANTPVARVSKLQAEAVMTRILHLRLVLLRPSVLAAARHSLTSYGAPPISSRAEMALQSEISMISIRAAILAVDTLHQNLSSEHRIISSNAVFVTMSAATVITAASLVSDLNVSIEVGGSHEAVITKAFKVLEEHRWQIEGARSARDKLEKFVRTVKQVKRRRSGTINPFQYNGEQLLSGMEDLVSGIDFTDPLWDLQWSDLAGSLNNG